MFVGLTASGLLEVFATPFGEGRCLAFSCSQHGGQHPRRIVPDACSESKPVVRDHRSRVDRGLMSSMLPIPRRRGRDAARHQRMDVAHGDRVSRRRVVNMGGAAVGDGGRALRGDGYRYSSRGPRAGREELFGRYVSRDVYDQLISHRSSRSSAENAGR